MLKGNLPEKCQAYFAWAGKLASVRVIGLGVLKTALAYWKLLEKGSTAA